MLNERNKEYILYDSIYITFESRQNYYIKKSLSNTLVMIRRWQRGFGDAVSCDTGYLCVNFVKLWANPYVHYSGLYFTKAKKIGKTGLINN